MDVSAFVLPPECSVAVRPASIAFVRSGTVSWQARDRDVLLDANYALLFPQGSAPGVLTADRAQACLTFVSASSLDFGPAPSVRLIDSPTFLEHYRLVVSAGCADSDEQIERIVSTLRMHAAEKPQSASAHSPSYGRSMQVYVNATLPQRFSLRAVAAACALSPFAASRTFHREAGIPLRTYIRRLRVRLSLPRIASARDLSEVALELGFFDHSHFTRAFRAEFGIAPSQWRELTATATPVAA